MGLSGVIPRCLGLWVLVLMAWASPAMALSTTWTGATDSDYNTASNWTAGVPGAADDALFTGSPANSCVVPAGAFALLTLTLDATFTGSLTLGSQPFTVHSSVSLLGGTFNANGQTLVIDNASAAVLTLDSGATFTAAGLTKSGAGLLQVAGTAAGLSLGALTISAGGLDASGRFISVSGATSLSGNLTLTGAPNSFGGSVTVDGVLTVNGTTDFNAALTVNAAGTLSNTAACVIRFDETALTQVQGTISISPASGLTDLVSTTASNAWDLNLTGAAGATFSNVRVQDGNVLGSVSPTATNGVDLGNNTLNPPSNPGWIGLIAGMVWIGGSVAGDWSVAANYFPPVLPGASDKVTFNASGAANPPPTLNSPAALGALDVQAGYSQALAIRITQNLTVFGNVTLDAASATSLNLNGFRLAVRGASFSSGRNITGGGASTLRLDRSGAGTTLLASGVTVDAALEAGFGGSNTVVTLGSAVTVRSLTVDSGSTFSTDAANSYALTLNVGALTVNGAFAGNGSTVSVAGNVTTSATTTFSAAGVLRLNGGGAQALNLTALGSLAGLQVSKGAGTVTVTGNLVLAGSLQLLPGNAGTLTLANSSLNSVAGSVSADNGTLAMGTTSSLSVGQHWTFQSGATFTPSSSTVTFNGTGAQTITPSLLAPFNHLTFSKASGTATLAAATTCNGSVSVTGTTSLDLGGQTLNVAVNVTLSAGSTLAASGSTLVFTGSTAHSLTCAGKSFHHLSVTGSASLSPQDNLTLTGALNVGSGTSLVPVAGAGVSVGGGSTISGTVTLSAANDTLSGGVTVNSTGSLAMGGGANVINGNLASAATVTSTGSLALNGDVSHTGGAFTVSAAATLAGSSISFATTGNVTFSDVTFNGGPAQSVNLDATDDLAGNITVAGSGNTVTFSDAIVLASNSTITVNVGCVLVLNGGGTNNWSATGTQTAGAGLIRVTNTCTISLRTSAMNLIALEVNSADLTLSGTVSFNLLGNLTLNGTATLDAANDTINVATAGLTIQTTNGTADFGTVNISAANVTLACSGSADINIGTALNVNLAASGAARCVITQAGAGRVDVTAGSTNVASNSASTAGVQGAELEVAANAALQNRGNLNVGAAGATSDANGGKLLLNAGSAIVFGTSGNWVMGRRSTLSKAAGATAAISAAANAIAMTWDGTVLADGLSIAGYNTSGLQLTANFAESLSMTVNNLDLAGNPGTTGTHLTVGPNLVLRLGGFGAGQARWTNVRFADIASAQTSGNVARAQTVNTSSLKIANSVDNYLITGTMTAAQAEGGGAGNLNGDNDGTVASTNITWGADDSSTTITAGALTEPASISSVATGSFTPVFDFRFTDTGAPGDGLPTVITGLTVRLALSATANAAQHNWRLSGPDLGVAATGSVLGTQGVDQRIVFSSLPISVANGGNETYTLEVQLNAASPGSADNSFMRFSLSDTDVTLSAGTTLAPAQTLDSGVNLVYQVVATELRLVAPVPSGAAVGATITARVEFTDVNGKRDVNIGASDVVTVTWSGAGAVNNGSLGATAGLCDFGAANLNLGAPGLLGGTLTFTDNGGGATSAGLVSINPFNLSNSNDANSTVTASGALVEPATISSIAAGFISVLDFSLNDQGTSDGLPTNVSQVVVNVSGPADASEHSWRLNGPGVVNAAGTVSAGAITFAGLAISVPNGTSQVFTLSLQLAAAPVNTTDNEAFLLAVSSTGLSASGGTSFAASGPVTNGAGLAYSVVTTRLTIKTQPGPSQVENVGFNVVVAYTDINGNVDADVTDTIVGITRSDAGAVTAPTLPLAAVAGVASFTGANQVRLGLPAATGITLTFTDSPAAPLTSATVQSSSFNLADNSPPTVTSAVLRIAADPRGRTIRLTFNEPLRASSVTSLSNYVLSFGSLQPLSVSQPATSQVDLVFPDYAVASLDTLAISGVQDVSFNTMAPVAAQAITSADAAAPSLVSITYNDSDGSGTPSPGDQYLFLFSEAVNDRVFSGGSTADVALSPAGLSYGTPNSITFGDDLGLATDSRLVVVTLVFGLTIAGGEAVTLSSQITDLSGNTVLATGLNLPTVDNISPRLVLTRLDDRDNSSNASPGDVLWLYFTEALNTSTVPAVNTSGQLNAALGLSAGGFGADATAAFNAGNRELLITLGAGSASIIGQTLNPAASVTDPAGNPDATSPAVAIGTGSSDIFAPTFNIAYSAPNPNAVPAGNLRVTVTFTDSQPTTPTIAINQPGINDLPPTNMVAVGGSSRIWQYDWTVSFADGTINIDGLNVISIVGRPTDLRGNLLVPAANNTFRTDTTNPAFTSVSIVDPDNHYRAGDTISILAVLNEIGLDVTANLSVVDFALGTQVAFVDNLDGTYSMTSPAIAAATLIEGSNLAVIVRARDGALNSSTFPVLVNVDNTAPSASLLYDQPSAAVGAGNLTITLSLSEPSPTIPTIAIAGLSGTPGVSATPMSGSAGQSSFTFILNVINPTTGTATVTIGNVSDLAGNPPALVANNSFTVDTQNTPLVANAGQDRTFTRPRQVQLDASASTGLNRSYAWSQDSGPAVTLNGANSAAPTFYMQAAGAYVFRVTVTSGASSADDTVTITLLNSLPDISAGGRITLDRNAVTAGFADLGLFGSALDVNGDSLFVQWTRVAAPASGNLEAFDPNVLATPLSVIGGGPMVPGVYTFELRVFDPAGLSAVPPTPALDRVDVIVTGPGVLPPSAEAGPDITAMVGKPVSLTSFASSDGDGTIVGWQWRPVSRPQGSLSLPSGAASATATFTPDRAGIYTFGLRVRDNDNLLSSEDLIQVIVHDLRSATLNRLPRAVIALAVNDINQNGAANVGESIALSAAQSSDADGDTLTLAWRQVAGPAALNILNPGAQSFSLTPALPGTYTLVLDVSDGQAQGISAEVSFTVAAAAATAPLAQAALSALDDPDADGRLLYVPGVGVDNQASNVAIDLDGGASTGAGLQFAWRQVSGPTVALDVVNAAQAAFVPTLAGSYVFDLTVTDTSGLSAVARVAVYVSTYDITASPLGNALPLASAGQDQVTQGLSPITLLGSATDDNHAASALRYRFVQVGGPPVVLDTTSPQQPTFVAPVSGLYVFDLYVDDGLNFSAPDRVQIAHTVAGSGGGSDDGGCSTSERALGPLLWALLAALALCAARLRRNA